MTARTLLLAALLLAPLSGHTDGPPTLSPVPLGARAADGKTTVLSNTPAASTPAARTTTALAATQPSLNTAAVERAGPQVRIKDIADIEGVRPNTLIGYGLVVGLAGTGDSSNSIPFTRQSLVNILEKMGVNSKLQEANLRMKNVAAVMVTAELPAFARQGARIDINVASLGDAKSLEGGQLLATPLVAADGNTYALAQGPLVLGGFTATGEGGSVSKNHTTAGRIAGGAVVEREAGFELSQLERLRLMLRNPDFSTARRIASAINAHFGTNLATPQDLGTVDVDLPSHLRADLVPTIDHIGQLQITPDDAARIVVDEKTGTVVVGQDVRISNVAISHANLTIRITETPQVSQPNILAAGQTQTVARTNISVTEESRTGGFKEFQTGVSLAELVDGLNQLGVGPRDIISILQSIKASGAIQAELKLL